MYYKRLNEIEQRFKRALTLMGTGTMNASTLAKELGVSRPTVLRTVAELRRRGHAIHTVRDEWGWHYEYAGKYLVPVRRTKPEISAET